MAGNLFWPGLYGPPSDEADQDEAVRDETAQDETGPEGHLLKMRFMETPAFLTLYEERYRHLYQQIYVEDLIMSQVNHLTSLFIAYNAEHNLVDQKEHDNSVDRLLDYVAKRIAYLEPTDMLSRQ